jgi:two-component system, cell cycle sensor histidine kinase and response regulator CckA
VENDMAEDMTALGESEESFHNLADHSPVMIWVSDSTGYCTHLSQSWYDFSGQTAATGLGFGWLDPVHPDDRESAQSAFLAANQRREAFQLKYRFRRYDGEYRWVIDAASPWIGTDGQFNGYIGSIIDIIDISDRKHTKANLSKSEEKYRSLFELIDQGVCLLEVLFDANDKAIDYRFIEINEAFEQQSGLVNAVGKTILELVPNLEPQWAERYGQVAKSGEAVRFEADVPSMNRVFDIYAFPSSAPGQNLVAVLFADITDRKRTEEILRRTAELDAFRVSLADALRLLTDASEIQAIAARTLGESLRASRVIYLEVMANNEEVIVHRNYTNGVAGLSGQYRLEDYRRNLTADHQAGQTQIVTNIPDNLKYTDAEKAKYHDLEIAAHIDVPLVKDNQFVALLAVHQSTPRPWTDTEVKLVEETAERTWAAVERARAESALRESEERYRTLFESIDDGFCTIEMLFDENDTPIDYRFLEVNPVFERQTGLSQAVGKRILEMVPENEQYWFEIYGRIAMTGKPLRFENEAKALNRWYDVYAYRVGQPEQRRVGILFRDISEKKQLEAQFYRAQRLESLGTLASGIAHDLNNVLTPILAISQLLRLQQYELNPRSQEMLQVLETSAQRGTNLIKQILAFTRGTGGARHPVQVSSVVQEVLNIVQQSFPRTITICPSLPDPCPWVVAADPTYLHQVLMNLCVNARDAMPSGGMLSLLVEQCFVDSAVAQANLDARVGDYVVITITDTGTGIPPEVRDRIFDPFFTTKPSGQGTGLGLATVLGIVKEYGGFLQVLSEVARGTQMKVYLPIIKETGSPSESSQQPLDGNGELVLLVDDDVAVQHCIQSVLENHHYTVLPMNDGIEAIALYTQHQHEIKLVILDIMMPKMSGITLIQRLRAINPTVKIMAMSGLPVNREPALATGANVFLLKPYVLENLVENLQTLIASKE